jgi:hypothetical protein
MTSGSRQFMHALIPTGWEDQRSDTSVMFPSQFFVGNTNCSLFIVCLVVCLQVYSWSCALGFVFMRSKHLDMDLKI